MKEKTFWGKLIEKVVPILIGIIIKKQKFIKTPQDEKRVDDIINNL